MLYTGQTGIKKRTRSAAHTTMRRKTCAVFPFLRDRGAVCAHADARRIPRAKMRTGGTSNARGSVTKQVGRARTAA